MPVTTRPVIAEPKRRALTPDETAARLGLTTKELVQLRRRGGGPTFVALTRSSVRYVRTSVDEWAARAAPSNEDLSA